MNTSIVNNKIIFSGDKTYFVIWRQKGGKPIPIHGKGNKGFTSSQRIEYNQKKIEDTEKQISALDTEEIDAWGQWGTTKDPKEKARLENKIDELHKKRDVLEKEINTRENAITKIKDDKKGLKHKELEGEDAHKMGTEWDKQTKLSDDESDSLNVYAEAAFEEVNTALRAGDIDAIEPDFLRHIDNAIDKSIIPNNAILFRGVDKDGIDSLLGKGASNIVAKNPARLKNKVISDRGFVSTSLDSGIAADFSGKAGIVMRIKVNKGQRGVFLGKISNVPKEAEVLLPRGIKFKITGVKSVVRSGHINKNASMTELDLEVLK